MITVDEQKSPTLIQEIQNFESSPETLVQIFTDEELDQIRRIRDEAYKDAERCAEKLLSKTSEPLGKMAHPSEELQAQLEKIIRPKLDEHCSEDYEMNFSFHRNFFPYGTHTDSGYDTSEKIYKQGIIPLNVFPEEGEVYTIIFDQKCYHSISYPRDLKTIESLKPLELKQIKDWSSKAPDTKELSKYWTSEELNYENFKGLSVALPFKWIKGNMAIWDRAHLHCSSDFKVHGIEGKSGLMWISKRVEKSN